MDRCPECGLALETVDVAGRVAQGCRECGGVLIGAGDLSALVTGQAQALAGLERRFSATLLARVHEGQVPECGRCGRPMTERCFPVAPTVPLHACATCRLIWLHEGRCEHLRLAVAPEPEPPSDPGDAANGDDGEVAEPVYDVSGHGPLGQWPQRLDGEPLLSWLVCGMPLWLALATVCLTAVLLGVRWEMALAWSVVATWPLRGLALLMALKVAWHVLDSHPDLSMAEAYLLVLRVVACLDLASTVICLVGTVSPYGAVVAPWLVMGLHLVVLGSLAGVEGDLVIAAMRTRVSGWWRV